MVINLVSCSQQVIVGLGALFQIVQLGSDIWNLYQKGGARALKNYIWFSSSFVSNIDKDERSCMNSSQSLIFLQSVLHLLSTGFRGQNIIRNLKIDPKMYIINFKNMLVLKSYFLALRRSFDFGLFILPLLFQLPNKINKKALEHAPAMYPCLRLHPFRAGQTMKLMDYFDPHYDHCLNLNVNIY